jgi:hypothetical protein
MWSSIVVSGVENLKWSVWGGDDSGMEEYGTEWLASSSEMLDCTRSSFDVARMKLNVLAIALSEEFTLEAEERQSDSKMARIEKCSRLDPPPVPNSSGSLLAALRIEERVDCGIPPGNSGISSMTISHCSLGRCGGEPA